MKIRQNMSGLDRCIRLLAGLTLIYVGYVDTSLVNNMLINHLLSAMGLLNLVAGMTGLCPIYNLAQVSTFRNPKPHNN